MNWNKISKARTKEEQEIVKNGLICGKRNRVKVERGNLQELIKFLEKK